MAEQTRVDGFFVTGTDTGAGKTLVATGLLSAASGTGLRTLGIKPVSAGCVSTETDAGPILQNDDALALQSAASIDLDYATVNPVAFEPAIAPHIAAERSGRRIAVNELVQHCRHACVAHSAQFVVIEGAGGWLVPLNESETLADFSAGLGFPVVIVVGMTLGCLNHALLTERAVKATGLPIAGWVANCIDPEMAASEENIRSLEVLLTSPLLGVVPYLGADATAARVAEYLQLNLLQRLES